MLAIQDSLWRLTSHGIVSPAGEVNAIYGKGNPAFPEATLVVPYTVCVHDKKTPTQKRVEAFVQLKVAWLFALFKNTYNSLSI